MDKQGVYKKRTSTRAPALAQKSSRKRKRPVADDRCDVYNPVCEACGGSLYGTSIPLPIRSFRGAPISPNQLPCRPSRGSQKPGIARRKGPRGDHSGPTRQQQHFRSKDCERDNDLLGQAFRVFFMG